MRVLVTGCAGLLGSRLIEWIYDNVPDVYIVGVDDLSGGLRENLSTRLLQQGEFHKLDLATADLNVLAEAGQSFDYVFHFAAYAAEGLSPFIRKFNYTNNLIATANLINYCIAREVKRLVFTSSMAVYGFGNPPFKEDDARNPIDPYGVAKYACEMDIQIAGEQHGLDWCIIRPHNVYGRGQNIFDPYRNVLGIWMYRHLNEKPLLIYGDGEQTRAFSYIDDSLPCLWRAAVDEKCSKQTINLGGINHTSILEAAHILADVMGSGKIEFAPARHEVKHAHSTWDKSVELLGFEHKTDLHDGLVQMWQWVKKLPMRERFIWSEYELNRGLYSMWATNELKSGK